MKTNSATSSATSSLTGIIPTRTFPTVDEVHELADAIARDGLVAHQSDLETLATAASATTATTATTANLHPGAVAVIQDASSPDAPRARAFMVLARDWSQFVEANNEQRRSEANRFNRAFKTLACRWERHRQLRSEQPANLDGLWRSRHDIESARAEIHMLRMPR